mmetsp:Transcript_916/g.1991  ORF Transcript_916/g.1991 Transcript_916/m.1991 type:complete len:303 (+) Transcript_916:66-974(+)|eukprot:CAMPEP_0173389036 /NCGR_PEP_ID=MMETSP1356-20130122/11200_1 /TAXON_ID=77927 ORGANISM="Hemiselmis virescens, Strain PCC157" /NCGR_SAMPLE_ID=MMETSP1356 /ASSEMBLY_ACC=CAM_ASM_000847 /LENGTH=302 /DNA_ID=CAMNT_0014346087 /DNA_START=64 /DNA_END=972 /DNA_ORIENTATION=+
MSGAEAFAEAMAAGLGGAFSSSVLYPIEICKNRLQASKKSKPADGAAEGAAEGKPKEASMVSVAKELYAKEKLVGFYRGFQYSAMQSATEKALYFYGYTWIVGGWKGVFGAPSTASSVLLGSLAEWFHLPVSLPIDAVTVRIQTGKGGEGPITILRDIITTRGFGALYSGWEAYLVLCLKPAITYAIFDKLKSLLLAKKDRVLKGLSALEAFVIGAIARGIATIIVFPYTRAKVLVKAYTPTAGEQAPSIAGTVAKVLKEDGFFALYQGCVPEVSRGVLSAALMLAAKEKIAMAVRKAIAAK